MSNEFGDSSRWRTKTPDGRDVEVLEGCRYQQVLVPLDYPPSRADSPRWGKTKPPHAGLKNLFDRDASHYGKVIAGIRELAPSLQNISIQFQGGIEPGWYGGAINPLDLAVLYYFMIAHRPKRYLEIGSGLTTLFAARAVRDHKLDTRIISIDPEPRNEVAAVCHENIRTGLECLPDLKAFETLEAGDIVFMDGSHRTFMNSDVTVFMLDILPLIKPGVLIHVHDIAWPFDYHEMFSNWYWNEQYILGVYLLAAAYRLKILMPCEYVSRDVELSKMLLSPLVDRPSLDPAGFRSGGSFWFTHTF